MLNYQHEFYQDMLNALQVSENYRSKRDINNKYSLHDMFRNSDAKESFSLKSLETLVLPEDLKNSLA